MCGLLHLGSRGKWRNARDSNPGHPHGCSCFQDSVLDRPDAFLIGGKLVLPRGLAPRASAFARRRAGLLHFGSGWKVAAVSGIAPDSSRLQRDANLSQLHSHGSPAWTCTTTTRLTAGHAALTSLGNSESGPSARYRAVVPRLQSGCSSIELRRN